MDPTRTISGFNQGSVSLGGYAPMQNPARQPKKKQSTLKSLLQFAAPVAGSIAGGFVGGPVGMVAGGAGASGLLNYLGGGREGQDPIDAAKQDALYSVLGMGVGKLAGPIVGKLGSKLLGQGAGEIAGQSGKFGKLLGEAKPGGGTLGRIGSETVENVARPDVAKGTFFESNVQDVMKVLRKYGVQGGPRAKSRAIDTLGGKLNEDVTSLLAQHNNIVPKTGIKELAAQIGAKGVSYGPEDKVFSKVVSKGAQALSKAKDVQAIYDIKSAQPVGKIFAKLGGEVPGTLTPREEATLSIWDTASDLIEKHGTPAIRTLNKEQNLISKGAIGFQKEAERTFSAPIVGGLGSGVKGGFKAGQDFFGRNLQGLGEAGQSTLGRATEPAAIALGAGMGGVAQPQQTEMTPQQAGQTSPEQTMGQPQNPRDVQMIPKQDAQGNKWQEDATTGEILSEDSQWRWNPQANDWESNTQLQSGMGQMGGSGLQQQLTALAFQDLQNGGKNLNEIAAFMKIAGIEPNGGMDANSKKKVTQLNQAETIITEFAKRALQLNPSESAPLARLKGLGATLGSPIGAISPEARAFRDNRKGIRVLLARAMGEVGNLSLPEQQAALDMIPDIGDSQEEVLLKTQGLVSIISGLRDQVSGTSQTTSTNFLTP